MPDFSHIYVERDVQDHPLTGKILQKFPEAHVILIDRYEQLFNRPRQSYPLQQKVRSLILARHTGQLVYPGSPVCQSFDQRYFYYTSSIMNCIYSCSYCWLKGLYPSAYPVVFVNLEDTFREVEEMLKEHPVYLCVSYDTDLLGMEWLCGYASRWSSFCAEHENLTIEIRSKGGILPDDMKACNRTIMAVTVSPEHACRQYESGAPSLQQRIDLIHSCMQRNMPVRLCFDPVLIYPGWMKDYQELVDQLAEEIDFERVKDVSIGTFRLSSSYLRRMRKQERDNAILQYPYVCTDGFYHLDDRREKTVEDTVRGMLERLTGTRPISP
jgi:spore photoproduct lyase